MSDDNHPGDPLVGLNGVIGMDTVRQEIGKLLAAHGRARCDHESIRPSQELHMLFVGPPGVGKTHVARALGEVLRARGLLRKGHVVLTDRAELVAGYIGLTRHKTLEICNRALDGLLVIEHAYMLLGGFAQEAIDALIEFMDANKGRILVVMTSFRTPLAEFAAACPELVGKFSIVQFPPCSVADQVALLRDLAGRKHLLLPDDLEGLLAPWIEWRMQGVRGGEYWRYMQSIHFLFGHMIEAQAARIAIAGQLTHPSDARQLDAADVQTAMAAMDR
jgi:hypothetical protein